MYYSSSTLINQDFMSSAKAKQDQFFEQLCNTLVHVHSKKEAEILLHDLFTPQELAKISERLKIVDMLAQGLPQRTIKKNLKVSIALVTRGSRAFKKSQGGFEFILKAIHGAKWWQASSNLRRQKMA